MPKIFISYRRADSGFVADIVHDYMERHFGADNVFLDVGNIPPGVDFRRYLAEQIAEHEVVLVIIGPTWADIMKERAEQENDFVRIEIESALKQNKLVIPVLVMEAKMPTFTDLPMSISDLQWRQSVIIRRKPDLENDCNRLAEGIRQYLKKIEESSSAATIPPLPAQRSGEGQGVRAASTDQLAAAIRAIIGAPFDLCDVPAGEFLYGKNKEKLTLPAFAIAKYPITYSQYKTFIAAKDGFSDSRWWQGLSADDNHKSLPGRQSWKIADRPRENVSWYDSIAFCRWLSFRLGGGFDINQIGEWAIRLPTEFEWEKAARGTDGREYPYGDMFDETKSNVFESSIGQTTPVTQYSQGASPYGVLDMRGNVWEWCLTEYDKPAQDVTGGNMRSDAGRVLRGGSWSSSNNHSRAVYRYSSHPDRRDHNLGFRVVCRPPSG